MKQLTVAVEAALGDIDDGNWSTIAATNGNFGLQEGDYVGLPTAEGSWNFRTFTVEEYEAVKEKIASGEIVVDNSSEDSVKPETSDLVTVNYIQ